MILIGSFNIWDIPVTNNIGRSIIDAYFRGSIATSCFWRLDDILINCKTGNMCVQLEKDSIKFKFSGGKYPGIIYTLRRKPSKAVIRYICGYLK